MKIPRGDMMKYSRHLGQDGVADRTLSFEIPIIPKAKKRPLRSKYGGMYTPPEQAEYEESMEKLLKEHVPEIPFPDAIKLNVIAYMPIPKSWPKWKQEAVRLNLIPHVKTPDADNLLKNICDCMKNMSFFRDDAQIVFKTIYKVYEDRPRWHVILKNFPYPKTMAEYQELKQRL